MIYTVEIDAWDPATSGLVRLRYATRGFATTPADSPPHAFYDERLEQPGIITRSMFSEGATSGRSKVGYGDLTLQNGDGALDTLLTYGFDGRPVVIRRGQRGAVYPSGFELFAELTAEQAEAPTADTIRLKLRDRQSELDVPLQRNTYTGDNVLPDGLEGVDDLLGKPKPRCFGQLFNVPAPCVNTAKLIYQVNDGPISSLDGVYDRGVKLFGGAFAVTSLPGSSGAKGCAFGLGRFVVVDGTGIVSAADGFSWVAATGDAVDSWAGIAFSEDLGVFVVVGAGGGVRSTDGQTWTSIGSPPPVTKLTWSRTLKLFVGVGGSNIYTSPTGITWTAQTSPVGGLNGITEGLGTLVAVGNGATVITSTNAVDWTLRTLDIGNDLADVAFGETPDGPMFLAVGTFIGSGDGPTIMTSPDSIAWRLSYLATLLSGDLYSVAFAEGVFLVGSDNNNVLVSVNAIDFTERVSGFGFGEQVNDLCYGHGKWLIVGGVGSVSNGFTALETPATYADAAELADDDLAPAAGEFKVWPGGGYFRLGAPPAGLVTADVTEGALAADRTAAQIFNRILNDPLGIPSLPVSAEDLELLGCVNLVLRSGEFEHSVWQKADVTADDNAWTAPDGTLTAARITENATAANHYVYQSDLIILPGSAVCGSVYIESAGRTRGRLYVGNIAGTNAIIGTYNLVTGTITPSVAGAGVLDHVSIVNLGRGRFRLEVAGWVNAGVTTCILQVNMYNDAGASSYTGDGVSGLFLWGPQLKPGLDVAPFIPTGATAMPRSGPVGLWSYEDNMTVAQACDLLARSLGAWWGVDALGVARLQTLLPASGTPVRALTANDLKKPPQRLAASGPTRGLPVCSTTVRYARNYAVQDTDLAAGVPDERRAVLSREWSEVERTEDAIQLAHPLSPSVVIETLLAQVADAAAEASRQQVLHGTEHDRFAVTIELNDETDDVDLGQVLTLSHGRYGLAVGPALRVFGVEPDVEARELGVELWR